MSRRRLLQYILSGTLMVVASCHPGKELSHHDNTAKDHSSERRIIAKYAAMMQVDEKQLSNTQLYSFIDEWYGVPYKYGGDAKSGIDCSNFTCTLYREIYKCDLSGTSASLFRQCKAVSRKELHEGDLLFFKISKDQISHVGVYLTNNHFVHATTKKGVMIDDLDEPYYAKYFYKAGRP